MLATETLRERGIRVYTIGIGEASGSILSYIGSDGIRTYFYDDKGEKLRADVDEAILRQIAEKTG